MGPVTSLAPVMTPGQLSGARAARHEQSRICSYGPARCSTVLPGQRLEHRLKWARYHCGNAAANGPTVRIVPGQRPAAGIRARSSSSSPAALQLGPSPASSSSSRSSAAAAGRPASACPRTLTGPARCSWDPPRARARGQSPASRSSSTLQLQPCPRTVTRPTARGGAQPPSLRLEGPPGPRPHAVRCRGARKPLGPCRRHLAHARPPRERAGS